MNRPPPAPADSTLHTAAHQTDQPTPILDSTAPPMIRHSTDHHEWVKLDTHRFGGQRKAFLINKYVFQDNQWLKLGDLGPAVMRVVEGGVEKGVC
jgi:hypothetical protein